MSDAVETNLFRSDVFLDNLCFLDLLSAERIYKIWQLRDRFAQDTERQRLSGVSFRSLESLQFSELHKGKFPDRNCIGPVVHFPGDWYEIRVCERHYGCVEARCDLT